MESFALLATWLRSVINQARHGMLVYEAIRGKQGQLLNFKVVLANESAAETLGWPLPTLAGRHLLEVFPQGRALLPAYEAVIRTGQPFRHEFEREHRHRPGEPTWFEVWATPLDDGLVISMVEVSQLKQAKMEADRHQRRSAEQLRSVFDASPWAILFLEPIHDAAGTVVDLEIVLANARAAVIGQRPLPQLVGGRMLELYPHTRSMGLFDDYVRVLETGQPFQTETRYDWDGVHGWYQITVVRQGNGLILTNSDLTDRKQAEHQKQESQALLSSVFDTVPSGVVVFRSVRDEAGTLVDFEFVLLNQESERGTRRTDLVGKRLFEEYPPARSLLFDGMVRTVETGEPFTTEFFYPHDPFHSWHRNRYAKFGDGLVEINENITDRKRAEQELIKNLTLLRQTEDLTRMGSWDYDIRTGAFDWSRGMYELFGLEPGTDISPETYLEFVTEDDQPTAERLVGYLRERHEPFEELLRVTVNEHVRTLHVKATVLRNGHGEPERVLGIDVDITRKLETEQSLRDSLHFNQHITQTSPDLVFVIDIETRRLVYANRSLAALLGYSPEQAAAMAQPFLDVVHPEDQPTLLRHLDDMKTALDGEVRELEYRVLDARGEIRWMLDRNAVFKRDPQGVPTEKIGFSHEVTDRRRAEQAVRETAEQLQAVFDTSQASITLLRAVRDARGRVVDFAFKAANHATAQFLNLPPIALPGRSMSEVLPSFKPSGLFDRYIEVLETGESQRFELLSGTRWLDVSLAKEDDGVVVTFLDITSSKQLQIQYQEQAEMLDGVLYNSANSLAVYDALRDAQGQVVDFRVRLFNRAALQDLALSWADVQGKTLLELSPASKENGVFQAAVEVLETDLSQTVTRDFPYLAKSFTIALSRLGTDGLIVGSVDITSLRQAQRQQEELLDELRRSNQSLERFAYVTSHDLQEPLRKIQSFGLLLQKRLTERLEPDELELLVRMQNAARRMKILIEELLTFSRLNAKKEAFRWLDLNRLVGEVLSDLDSAIQEKAARVSLGTLPSLPGDALQWRQLFQNLVSNALKFSRPGVPPHVKIRARTVRGGTLTDEPTLDTDRTYHEISVADNGVGFEDEFRERIFDLFQRLHGRSEYEGTGIGLAIVKKVAEQHQGAVKAVGRPGQGATFYVYVPVSVEDQQEAPARDEPLKKSG